MNNLYKQKHQLWLKIVFASFAINDENIKSRLYDFSQISFRHLKWIGTDVLEKNDDYNYDRDYKALEKFTSNHTLLQNLKSDIVKIQELYDDSILAKRVITDEYYLLQYIDTLLANKDEQITAYDIKMKWDDNLDEAQTKSLVLFLFEESYKEYELIMVYAYMQARTKNALHFNVFQDLIDESHFHLKSFGNMMAKLGILTLPRELHEMTYKVKDLDKFVVAGIAEEEAAKEMCKQLSESISNEELSKFFDFINYQENYHIELMKKLL